MSLLFLPVTSQFITTLSFAGGNYILSPELPDRYQILVNAIVSQTTTIEGEVLNRNSIYIVAIRKEGGVVTVEPFFLQNIVPEFGETEGIRRRSTGCLTFGVPTGNAGEDIITVPKGDIVFETGTTGLFFFSTALTRLAAGLDPLVPAVVFRYKEYEGVVEAVQFAECTTNV